MTDFSLTADELCKALSITPSTLRAWHNRQGLLPRGDGVSTWRRYGIVAALHVYVVNRLINKGYKAQDAVNITHALSEQIEIAALDMPEVIVIVGEADGGGFEIKRLPSAIRDKNLKFYSALQWPDDDAPQLLYLTRMRTRVMFIIAQSLKLPVQIQISDGK